MEDKENSKETVQETLTHTHTYTRAQTGRGSLSSTGKRGRSRAPSELGWNFYLAFPFVPILRTGGLCARARVRTRVTAVIVGAPTVRRNDRV